MSWLRPSRDSARRIGAALAVAASLAPAAVWSGGFDSALVHSARHLGVGGAVTANIGGAVAPIHNPAGLAATSRGEFHVEGGVLVPRVLAAPASGVQAHSQVRAAPFGMLAASVRVHPRIAVGLALHPIAAAGAEYHYDGVAGPVQDGMRALIAEASPALALSLPFGIRFGAGFRVTAMRLRREVHALETPHPGTQLAGSGIQPAGFRLGMQWTMDNVRPDRGLALGVSYRHQTRIEVSGRDGRALGEQIDRFDAEFILPGRVAFGAHGTLGPIALVGDVDLTLNSQNDRSAIRIRFEDGERAMVPNVFAWKDSFAVRGGMEFLLQRDAGLTGRLGAAWDGAAARKAYPTAFGPPPAAAVLASAGLGIERPRWSASLAYGHRRSETRVHAEDVVDSDACAFCGFPGTYRMRAHIVSIDWNYHWPQP